MGIRKRFFALFSDAGAGGNTVPFFNFRTSFMYDWLKGKRKAVSTGPADAVLQAEWALLCRHKKCTLGKVRSSAVFGLDITLSILSLAYQDLRRKSKPVPIFCGFVPIMCRG